MKDRGLFVGLIFLTIFVLFFGFFKIKEAIQGPFRVPKSEKMALTNEEVQQILAKKDTDEDGISDADEIFKYGTSIYLTDSDSDGYSDKEEIEAGSDPTNQESTPLRKVVEKPKEEVQIPSKTAEEPSPAEIREFLIKAGMDKETVEKVDDETLKKLYNETVKETGIKPEELTPGGLGAIDFSKILKEQPSQKDTAGFENLTPQEIRQLLLTAGADPNILGQIDDQTLKTLFLQAIKESQQ